MNTITPEVAETAQRWWPSVALVATCVVVFLLVRFGTEALRTRVARRRPAGAELISAVRLQVSFIVPFFIALESVGLLGLAERPETLVERVILCFLDVLFASAAIGAFRVVGERLMSRYRSDAGGHADTQNATRVAIITIFANVLVWLVASAFGLLIFPEARSIGATLLASAGIVGIAVGVAAKPLLENLIAGVQVAFGQSLRLDDIIVVNGEYGVVEEITATYLVVRTWDRRRLVYPLTYFTSNAFENWTRRPTELLGAVMLYVDFCAPVEEMRAELSRILADQPNWTGGVGGVQVTDMTATSMQVRILVSASSPPSLFDLRCAVRERMIAFLHERHPGAFSVQRNLQSFTDDGEDVGAQIAAGLSDGRAKERVAEDAKRA